MRNTIRHVVLVLVILVALGGAAPLAAAVPPLSLYGQLPGFERAAMSPHGTRIAIVGTVEGVRRLIVLDQDGKPLTTLPLGDAKIQRIEWAGDDRVLVFKSDTTNLFGFTADKTDLSTVVVVSVSGDKLWSIFERDEMIQGGVRGFYGIQQRDGTYYGYFSGITDDGDTFRGHYLRSTAPVLYEVNLQSHKSRQIGPRFEAGFRDWVVAVGGTIGARLDYTTTTGNWQIRNAAGDKVAEGVNPLGAVGLYGLGATPDTVILGDRLPGQELRLYEVPLAGGERKEILADAAFDDPYFDSKTGRLMGYREEGDVPAYTFSDVYRQKVVNAAIKAFPGSLVQLESWNDAFDRLIVMTEGIGDPQTWWTIDIKTGKANELGYAYPMSAADVAPMRMVHYKAADGTQIAAVLTLPPGRQPKTLPVIIFPHGGPASRDYPVFDWWAQALATRGYAVLQPNFRGSTGYGVAFQNAGHGEWGRKMQSDLSDGLAWLVGQGIVDAKRACIMGGSYGGYAALAGVTLQHGLYRCAVAVAGVSDVAKLTSTDIHESDGDETMKRALTAEIGLRKDLKPISPLNFVAQADAPILLIHGKDDTVVPYQQSSDMAAALRGAGKPVEFVTLPGEDHHLSRSATRLAMLEATVRFISEHNPPDPAP